MSPLKIGISACYFHADPQRAIFKGKTLLYIEQSLAHWVMSEGVLAYMIPDVGANSPTSLSSLAQELDGLVLHGGSDVAPETYGETPLKPEWKGDAVRDRYEIALVKEFQAQKKPVLGVCRGLQLLNVAFGGTLVQDIGTQLSTPVNHRNWDIYDQNFHDVRFVKGSRLERIYGSTGAAGAAVSVNSIHHQAIKTLGKGLIIEAQSVEDQIIEAVRLKGDDYVVAVQWHPEFHDRNNTKLLNSKPLLQDFLKEAQTRK